MKWINKQGANEPTSLVTYRQTTVPKPNYDDYRSKNDLREALLNEQGYICAYCMRRIQANSMVIEHYKSQSQYPELQLKYRNMLGCCTGGEGSLHKHCDESRKNTALTINPLDKAVMRKIMFDSAGRIYTADNKFVTDLDTVLNLNNQNLTKARKSLMTEIGKAIATQFEGAKPTREYLERQIQRWNTLDGKYKPMCQVAVYHLEKKLSKI